MHTCRIILFTSLVWFLLDVAVLVYYSDSPSMSRGNSIGDGSHAPVPHNSLGIVGAEAAGDQLAKREVLNDRSSNSANYVKPGMVSSNQLPQVDSPFYDNVPNAQTVVGLSSTLNAYLNSICVLINLRKCF